MPRKRRTRLATTPVVPQVSPSANSDDEERSMRTQVFEKTKMCKFHILGACAKGSTCRFAHFPSELNTLPDLACTKLCKALIATGMCENPECRYAHSQEELRPMPFGQTVGYGAPEREKERRPHAQLHMGALIQPVGQVVPVATRTPAPPAPAMHMQKALHRPPMMGQETGYRTDFSRWEVMAQEDSASVASDGYRQLGLLGVRNATPPRMPKVSSAAARLCTMGQDTEDQPVEALRMPSANEPVQINLHSLRSLSGSNLAAMAEDTDRADWVPPLMHSRHNSFEHRESSLAKSTPMAPMMIPPVASGLGPLLGETTEEANMSTTTVEQFWQSRDGDSHFGLGDQNNKLAPNQWMDQTYLGDKLKGYPSWPKGFEHMDSFYSDSGLCTVGSQ